MKKPLISYKYRLVARKVPDSFAADQVRFTIAWAKLKREIGKELLPLVKRIDKCLQYSTKVIRKRQNIYNGPLKRT